MLALGPQSAGTHREPPNPNTLLYESLFSTFPLLINSVIYLAPQKSFSQQNRDPRSKGYNEGTLKLEKVSQYAKRVLANKIGTLYVSKGYNESAWKLEKVSRYAMFGEAKVWPNILTTFSFLFKTLHCLSDELEPGLGNNVYYNCQFWHCVCECDASYE